MVSPLHPPVTFDFQDQDYHYKSVATQTPHDARLALICPIWDKTQDFYIQGSDSASVPQQQIIRTIYIDNNGQPFCTMSAVYKNNP